MKNLFNLIFAVSILLIFVLACTISSPFQQPSNPASPSPTAPASQTPASNNENEKLKEKLDELEKKVAEQEKQKTPPVVTKTVPIIKNTGNFARVNSPNDGFLALRSEPSSNYGDRILQIPHGAVVKVLGCQGFRVNIGGRSGRWCRISYEGYTGWAFDGWLIY